MFANIPAELRALPQWVVADMTINPETGLPKKHPLNPRTGQIADVSNPATWGTFEDAIHTGYKHIGFVLSHSDPFCIIDLDNKPNNPASQEELERQHKILNVFDSYTERSVSGTGYHIILKGSIPTGVHRDKVEVYSSGRYMICTGDVVRASPINEYQTLLNLLYGEMAPPKVSELVDHDAIMTDSEVIEMGMRASNSDKFNQLCCGDWTSEYPSQSEADFALLSIIAYYTRDNEQVRRLFRMTALGKRDKATKNDVYLNRALEKIRAQQPADVDLSQMAANAAALMNPAPPAAYDMGTGGSAPSYQQVGTNQLGLPQGVVDQNQTVGGGVVNGTRLEAFNNELTHGDPPSRSIQNIALPPGIIGELATYFYQTAIRPVPEIALAAAIAIVAGVVGRSYNISGSGLNQYLILLARTGSGKEGAMSGIENLITAIRPQIPMADQFLGPAAFASGQALVKVLNDRPCFVSVLGEFGLTLQQMSDHRANASEKMLKKVLLDLYAKSGWNRTLRSSVYSDIEKNTKIIQAPNVTILGESTPETFFNGLDASHIAEGLIPRFSVIEYDGPRPPRNRNSNTPPSQHLAQRFSDLIAVALTTTNNNTCCPVAIDPAALVLMDKFDTEADHVMNSSKHDVEVQLWNRAHLKVLKLAALLAVGCNPHAPTVTPDTAQWAIDFIKQEIEGVAGRFKDGDVGQGDSKQSHDLRRVITNYLKTHSPLGNEALFNLHKAKLIPYRHLAQRCGNMASFRADRLGATHALKRGIQSMIDSGVIVEIPGAVLQKSYKYSGIAYGIGTAW